MAVVAPFSQPWQWSAAPPAGSSTGNAPSQHHWPETRRHAAVGALPLSRGALIGLGGIGSLALRRRSVSSVPRRQTARLELISPLPADDVDSLEVDPLPLLPLSLEAPTLHTEQERAKDEICDAFRCQETLRKAQGTTTVTMHGVTGSGKTLVAANVISEMSKWGCRAALIIAPIKELVRQTCTSLDAYFADGVPVHRYVSQLRKYHRPRVQTRNNSLRVLRAQTMQDQDARSDREYCMESVKESRPCIICSSTSAIHGRGCNQLSPELAEHVADQLKRELEEADKSFDRKLAGGISEMEFFLNTVARRQRQEEDAKRILANGTCPDFLDLYGDLLDKVTLISEMKERYGNNWLLIIDECHSTLPRLETDWRIFRSSVSKEVYAGVRRPRVLEKGGPLTEEELRENLPSYVLNMSATPRDQDLERSDRVVQLHIRPTHILNPGISTHTLPRSTCKQVSTRINTHCILSLRDKILEIVRDREEDHQVILSCISNVQASVLHSILNAQDDLSSEIIDGEMDALEKKEKLERFRSGEIDILCGSKSLVEGMDFPSVALVIVPDADTGGLFRADKPLTQLIGRAARNVKGHAHFLTTRPEKEWPGFLQKVIRQNEALRVIQEEYNQRHGTEPQRVGLNTEKKEVSTHGLLATRQRADASADSEFLLQDLREIELYRTAQIMATVLQSCSSKVDFDDEDQEAPYWSNPNFLFDESYAPAIRIEQVSLMAVGWLIGSERSYNLLAEFGSLSAILALRNATLFAAVDDVGPKISSYMTEEKFRASLRRTRSKMLLLRQIVCCDLDGQLPVAKTDLKKVSAHLMELQFSQPVRALTVRMLVIFGDETAQKVG